MPQAMYTAELSTALPVDGGISVWARVAWSEFWGFQGGLWAWMEGVSTLAAYPTLVVAYLEEIAGDWDPIHEWLAKAGIACLLVLMNLRGTSWVGHASGALGVFVLAPLVAFSILGIPQMDISKWNDGYGVGNSNWTYFFNLMLWNLSGYDNMGAVSGEVHQPAVTVPRAQVIAVIAGSLAYLIPLGVATAVDSDWTAWHEGHLAMIGSKVAGDWLGIWILIGAAASRSSNFMAELCTNSFFLQGMGDQALLPAIFAWRHPSYDTPWVSILFNFLCILFLMLLGLSEILQLANVFTAASFLLGISSLLRLRKSRPIQTRDVGAFIMPLSETGILIWFAPAFFLVGLTVFLCTRVILLLGILLFAIGHLLFYLLQHARRSGWIEFAEAPQIDAIKEVWFVL